MAQTLTVQEKADLTKRLIEAFGKDMDFFYANTHDDVVLELPYGASNNFVTRVEGKKPLITHFASVIAILQGWQPYDITVEPMADPDRFLLQYKARCEGRFGHYEQEYCTIIGYRDDKLVLFREHWDTARFEHAWGDAKEAEKAALKTA